MNLTILPSISYYSIFLIKEIASHPLVINPIVCNPITEEPIPISRYRLRSGLNIGEGLVCSVYPYGGSNPSPSSAEASALYKPYNLGKSTNESIHHFVIDYSMNLVNFDGADEIVDPLLTSIPGAAIQRPEDTILKENSPKSTIKLEMNTSMFIIADYLELTRLIIQDIGESPRVNPPKNAPYIRNMEVVYSNIDPVEWDKKKEVYFHRGTNLIRVHSYLSNSWQEKFHVPVDNINLDIT
jgi:hypothetical protein